MPVLLGLIQTCNVCYTLKRTNKLSTTHAAISDDSDVSQTSFILISVRCRDVFYVYLEEKVSTY